MPFIQFQIRRDISTSWVSTNPTLADGEMGLETDTGKLKVGDGITSWYTLPYMSVGGPVSGSLVPAANNVYDLGAPGSSFRHLYIGGPVSGSLVPAANNVYDLGAPGSSFRHLYVTGSTIFLGSAKLSADDKGNVSIVNASGQSTIANQQLSTFINFTVSSLTVSSINGLPPGSGGGGSATALGTLAGNMNMTGGGLVSWSSDSISWSDDINLVTNPANGRTTTGTTFKIAPSTVVMTALDSLYYAPPLGSTNPYNPGSLHIINGNDRNHQVISDNWFLVANTSIDNVIVKWNPANISIPPDATYDSDTAQPSWISGGGGGGGTATGPQGAIQYKNAGNFAGNSNLTYNGTVLAAKQISVSTLTNVSTINGVPYTPGGGGGSNVLSENFSVVADVNGRMAYTYDGTSWNLGTSVLEPLGYTTIAWNGSYWMAAGNSTNIITSSDGINWAVVAPSPMGTSGVSSIAWNGSLWIAVGGTGTGVTGIATSPDGIIWTKSINDPLSGKDKKAVAWNGSYWVVVGGNGSGGNTIATSYDGMNWTPRSSPFDGKNSVGIIFKNKFSVFLWAIEH